MSDRESMVALADPPGVSIIICTYNRGRDLRRTLGSLQRLTYARREVVVVDNGSTDDTQAVIAQFPVRSLREDRQGLSHARNRGIDGTTGDAVLFLDDDITVENDDFLEQMLATLRSDPRIGIVGGRIHAVQVGEGHAELSALLLPRHGQDLGARDLHFPGQRDLIGASVLYRREAIGQDRFNPELGRRGKLLLGREELDFSQRVHAKGWHSAYCAGAVARHWIQGSRFTWSFVLRHQFAEGISEYLEHEAPRWLWRHSVHRPLAEALHALTSTLAGRRTQRAEALIRMARAAGLVWGPVFRVLSRSG